MPSAKSAKTVKTPVPADSRKPKAHEAHASPPAKKAVPTPLPAVKASTAVAQATAAGAAEAAKSKLVRDSFTIPKSEYVVLEALKLRAAKLARPTKKGELLRAGINALHAMGDKAFLAALAAVPSLKTGRPKRAA